jgi:pimeloyl-ACP methyl ester carboxylesterase
VRSPDGTDIGVRRFGRGPALGLVHGTTGDATRWAAALPFLAPRVTVYAMDRRGRGASGDTDRYSLDPEAQDVAAVVEAAAHAVGAPVDLLGHSFGVTCALEAARITDGVRRLVLYESGVDRVTVPASSSIGYTTCWLATEARGSSSRYCANWRG